MKTNLWMLVAVAMTSALSQACTAETESLEEIEEASSELRMLNGDKLSGVSLNGVIVGNATLSGVNYTNVTIGGVAISNVHLVGTVLHGTLPSGPAISGADFIGAELTGQMSDGSTVTLKIDNVQASAQADVLHYTVSFRQGTTGAFIGLCGVDSTGSAVKAFPLAGRWDNSQGTATGGSFIDDASKFTMACRGAAIAKCAEAGYKPWTTTEQCTSWGECSTVSVQPLHQACIRMVRADYCGNGDSFTVSGTEIDIYDGLGMHDADPTAEWDIEAEWTPKGAQCVNHVRWSTLDDVDVVQYMRDTCPEKAPGEQACGGEDSTFFVDNGFMTPSQDRVFLRNKSYTHN